jgi:hypothetical protein
MDDFELSKRIEEISNLQSSTKLFGIISYIDPKKFIINQDYKLNKTSDVYNIEIIL